jgi:polar amino acid transport system ATP-binding protein
VVLRDLDLDVEPGERVVIIGPSGSGKTTILRVIMTLERIDGARSRWAVVTCITKRSGGKLKDASEKHMSTVRSDIGMVFQHFNLFPT